MADAYSDLYKSSKDLLDALDEQEKVVCSPKKEASNNV